MEAKKEGESITCEFLGTSCDVPEHEFARQKLPSGRMMPYYAAFPDDDSTRVISGAIRGAGLRPRGENDQIMKKPLFAQENRRVEALKRIEAQRRADDMLRPDA